MSTEPSDLDKTLESLGKTVEGVAGRIFGPKAVGLEELPESPAISAEADEAISQAADSLGRLLNAAGTALREHPMDPGAALKSAQAGVGTPVESEEGWSPLTAGLRSLGGGLFKVAEGVLDQVAPRKPRPPGFTHPEAADTGATQDPAPKDPKDLGEDG